MDEETNLNGAGVYDPKVIDFVKAANDYCQWLENCDQLRSVEFISSSLSVLSGVYLHAVQLTELEPQLEGGNEKFVTEQDWANIYQKVLHLLGKHNEYLRIAENDEFDRSDLVTQKISEDLADIYQDLKDFTLQYRQGIEEIMNDAVWEVMDNFDNYWSEKLLSSLQALNKLYISKIDPEDEEDPGTWESDEDAPHYDPSFFTRLQDSNEEDD